MAREFYELIGLARYRKGNDPEFLDELRKKVEEGVRDGRLQTVLHPPYKFSTSIGRIDYFDAQREALIREDKSQPRMVVLSPTEANLFGIFARLPGFVLPTDFLAKRAWDGCVIKVNVRMSIKHLRDRIEPKPHQPIYIVNVRSAGYRFAASAIPF